MKKVLFILCLLLQVLSLQAQLNLNVTDTTVCRNTPIQVCANIPPVNLSGLNFDDRFSGTINIGFPFVFYGQTVTQCLISENNFITFDLGFANSQSANYTYNNSLNSGELNRAILFPYQDLDVSFGGVIRYMTVGQAPNRKFVVEFCDVVYYSNSCHNLKTRNQLVLYEGSNMIEMHLGQVAHCNGWPTTNPNGHAVQGIRGNGNQMFVTGRAPNSAAWTVSSAAPEGYQFVPAGANTYTLSTVAYNPVAFIQQNQGAYSWYSGNATTPFANTVCATITPDTAIDYYVVKYTGLVGCGATSPSTLFDTVRVNYQPVQAVKSLTYCASQLPITWNGLTIPAGTSSNTNYDTVMVYGAANACDTNFIINLTVIPGDTPVFTPVPPQCAGAVIPALPLTSNNGITGTWSPAINNNATTTYTFTPAAGQCAPAVTMTIVVNPVVTPTFTQVGPVCTGAVIPALPLTSNNGVSGTWSPAINNNTTTTYTFTPSTGQCAITATMTIVVNPVLTPSFSQVPAICSGAALSPLPTTSLNGVTGTWSPALNNTQTTTYTFSPASGQCAVSTTMTITVNPNVVPTFNAVAPICTGESLSALPTTSLNGVTGTWSPALNNTATTTYTFTPASGQCASSTTMTITVNPSVVPVFTQVAPICAGGTLNTLPTTSNNNITGTWSPVLNNTQTTTYTFTPTAGQCAASVTMTIVVNPILTPVFTPVGPVCPGTTLNPLPTTSLNGVTGTWSPALNNTATTTYTFTPASGQCANSTTMMITVNPNVVPTFNAVAPICAGESLSALPTTSLNGVTGTWSPALNNTATTTYTFTPASGQCASSITMTITVNPSVVPVFTQVAPICAGGTLNPLPATSNNNISGTWSPALDNTQTTTYTFMPTAGQCAASVTMTIVVNPVLPPSFIQVPAICTGGTLNPLPTTSLNGVSGTWSPALNNTQTTTYTFTPASGQCAVSTTMTINVSPNVVPAFNAVAPICAGASLSALPLTSTNGITGTWSPALNNTATTTYTFTPNPGQCGSPVQLTIQVIPNTTPVFTQVAPVCPGTVLNPLPGTSNNGITGTWSPALNNMATTTYTFTPAAGQACVLPVTMQITVQPYLTGQRNVQLCEGSTYTFNGITYTTSVSGVNDTIPNTGTCDSIITLNLVIQPRTYGTQQATICDGASYLFNGQYYTGNNNTAKDTLINQWGCDSIVTLNLNVIPVNPVTASETAEGCGSLTYNGQQYTASTQFIDTLTNVFGCDSVYKTVNLIVFPEYHDTLRLDVFGCDSALYNQERYYASTQLTEVFQTSHGCDSLVKIVTIEVHQFDLATVVSPERPYAGEAFTIEAFAANNVAFEVLSWTPASLFPDQTARLQRIALDEPVQIVVTATSKGCVDTAMVNIGDLPTYSTDVQMPNAFSPNGDGKNDVFRPVFKIDRAYTIDHFTVYNRYGQLIYTTSNMNSGWDGYYKGRLQDQGVYYYIVKIRFMDGSEKTLKGDVTLIR